MTNQNMYALFFGDKYYPKGLSDFVAMFATEDEAIKAAQTKTIGLQNVWAQVGKITSDNIELVYEIGDRYESL